jgi:hypothetical protein
MFKAYLRPNVMRPQYFLLETAPCREMESSLSLENGEIYWTVDKPDLLSSLEQTLNSDGNIDYSHVQLVV